MRVNLEIRSWIFLSHASADLPVVRKIRNYLEDQGAAPLMFHLLALKDPEEFWPIIRREIETRNFFLLCDSPAARKSDWVRREKEAVDKLRAFKPVRVERIDITSGKMDETTLDALDELVRKTRVFLYYNVPFRQMIEPYQVFMEEAGFEVSDISPRNFFLNDSVEEEVSVEEMLKKRFIVYFCYSGQDRMMSPLDDALMSASDRAIFVFLDEPPIDHPGLNSPRVVRAWEDEINAPNELIRIMMSD